MKHIKIILLLFVLVPFSGCKKSMMIMYGIRQPRVENYKSEKKFLEKFKLPTDEIIVYKDSIGIYKMSYKGISLVDAAFFSTNGMYMPYKVDTITCNAGISAFIESLNKGTEYDIDTSFNIGYLFKELVYSETQQPVDTNELYGEYDYYVLIFWAAYTGKLNKVKIYDWYATIQEQKAAGLNIRAYYINLDCQEFWGYTNKDLPKFQYGK